MQQSPHGFCEDVGGGLWHAQVVQLATVQFLRWDLSQ